MSGSLFGSKRNRGLIAWWGGGIVIVIAGVWAAFVYIFPPKGDGGEGKGDVSASQGGVSVGGAVTNSTEKTSPAASDEAQPSGY
jgi:hypothetical protein